MKIIGWIAVLVIIAGIAGGAYYYFVMKPTAPDTGSMPAADAGTKTNDGQTAPGPVSGEQKPDENSFRWTFVDAGTAASPKTKVTFHYNLGTMELGTYEGSCTQLKASAWTALPGEVDGVICYFAGFGTELAIFKEGAIYVAKKGVIEEGSEETGNVRGNFEVIAAL